MDNYRSYAVDIAVDIIEQLSQKRFFKDLKITVVGGGSYQAELISPLKKFPNVTITNRAVSPQELAELFQHNGILLAPSRYDTQGLTACEAAMSGLVVVASDNTGLSDILPDSTGTFFSNKNISKAVDILETLYKDSKLFTQVSQFTHKEANTSLSKDAVSADLKYML